MRYRLRTLMIVLAIAPIALFALCIVCAWGPPLWGIALDALGITSP
jgi:uncharacterized membrane protein YdjX (TVP38/TMEM64 family)